MDPATDNSLLSSKPPSKGSFHALSHAFYLQTNYPANPRGRNIEDFK